MHAPVQVRRSTFYNLDYMHKSQPATTVPQHRYLLPLVCRRDARFAVAARPLMLKYLVNPGQRLGTRALRHVADILLFTTTHQDVLNL